MFRQGAQICLTLKLNINSLDGIHLCSLKCTYQAMAISHLPTMKQFVRRTPKCQTGHRRNGMASRSRGEGNVPLNSVTSGERIIERQEKRKAIQLHSFFSLGICPPSDTQREKSIHIFCKSQHEAIGFSRSSWRLFGTGPLKLSIFQR